MMSSAGNVTSGAHIPGPVSPLLSPPPSSCLTEQQAATHREESKKLKAYIVKMKKELTEVKEQVILPSSLFPTLSLPSFLPHSLPLSSSLSFLSQESVARKQLEGQESVRGEVEEVRERLEGERDTLQRQLDELRSSVEAG